MSYHWDLTMIDGSQPDPAQLSVIGADETFPDQQQAEQWLKGFFMDLTDLGVTEVSLYEEDRLVYGPMSLEM